MNNSALLQIYTQAFETMDDMIYLIDNEGYLIDLNENLLRFLDCNRSEISQVSSIYELMNDQGFWTFEQIQNFQEQDIQAILSGKSEREQQAIISGSGVILYLDIARTPLSDSSGKALGLSVVFRDISKLKQLRDQVKHLKSQVRYNHSLVTNNAPSEQPRQVDRLKVLLIEDNPLAQKAEKMILMNCRCLIDVVATSTQAEILFKPGKYDLVLMDLTLEEGDGYNLTATLRKREQGSNQRVPIIALTGHDPMVVGFNCEDAEMDGILRKPLTFEQANQLIQRYVRHADVQVKGLRAFKQ